MIMQAKEESNKKQKRVKKLSTALLENMQRRKKIQKAIKQIKSEEV